MKKIIFFTAIIIMFGFSGKSQSDGFFSDWRYIEDIDHNLPGFPTHHGNSYNSDPTPVGSGVLILTAFGIGYAALKRKDSESS